MCPSSRFRGLVRNVKAQKNFGLTLVTGTSGGIGSAVVRRLAQESDEIALVYRSTSPDELKRDLGSKLVFAESWDLTDDSMVADGVARLTDQVGPVRTVVHAAGPHVPMIHLSKVEPKVFGAQLRQDVEPSFNLAHAVLPALRQTAGSLTFITTAATRRYPVRDGLSAAPKGAVEALARGLAAEEGRFGIRVNCVGPGMLVDGMAARLIGNGDLDGNALEIAKNNIPLRCFGTASDIAEAVAYLASDAARFVTGQKLDIDGGYGI